MLLIMNEYLLFLLSCCTYNSFNHIQSESVYSYPCGWSWYNTIYFSSQTIKFDSMIWIYRWFSDFFSLMIYIHSLTFHIPPPLLLPALRQNLTNRVCRKLCLLAYHTPVNYHDKWPASLCCWADQRQLLKSRQYTHTLASYSVCRYVLYRVVDVILLPCVMYLNWGVSLWPSFGGCKALQWLRMR